jgi:Zn-dependent peptidase ImmA (M78 family)/transcriptional regulator with XRE-family HTH domain
MINGERVRQAREIAGLTQAELAKLADIDQSYISFLEKGQRDASEEVVHRIAMHTKFPLSFFKQESGPEFPLGSLLFRRRQSLTSRDRDRIRQVARLTFEIAGKMLRRFQQIELRLPRSNEEPRVAARLARAALGLSPDSPVSQLISKLEKNGVFVLAVPFHIDEHDAFSVWADTDPRVPIIILSSEKPGDRQRRTVAHELGHLVLHRATTGDVATIEDQADAFASEFLLPEEAMRREIPDPLTLSALAELKSRWGTSMQSIVMRAHELQMITTNQQKYLFQQMSMKGWRKKEPVPIPSEKPRLLAQLAESIYGNPIDHAKFASDVGVPSRLIKTIIAAHATRSEVSTSSAQTSEVVSIFEHRRSRKSR